MRGMDRSKAIQRLRHKSPLFLFAAATCLLAGCQNSPVISTAPNTDMPIPTGAKVRGDQSLVLRNKDYWTGRIVLESDSNIS